jgi:hypothetical protein
VQGGVPQASTEPAPGAPSGPGFLARTLAQLNPVGSASAAEAPAAPAPPGQVGVNPNAPAQIPPPPAGQGVTTAKPPESATPPPAQPGPVQVKGETGKVVPNQQGPSTQSETTPAPLGPPVSPRFWAMAQRDHPEIAAMIQQVVRDHGGGVVTPEQVAAIAYRESRFRPTADAGDQGRGLMGIIPSTQQHLDHTGRMNALDPHDSLVMGVEYLKELAVINGYGGGTVQQNLAYMRGPGGVAQASQDWSAYAQKNPIAYNGVMMLYDGNAHITNASFPGGAGGDRPYSLQGTMAAAEAGPTGVLNYVASNGPPGLPMSDRWRSLQGMMESAAIAHGKYDALPHIQEWIAQQSHQGALSNLASAHQALVNGDTTGAANYLARAHAFFPDGSFARFGVDKSGALWAEQFGEKSHETLGKPMRITPEAIAGQMIQLQHPTNYIQALQQHQKANADIDLAKAHGDYYRQLPAIMEGKQETAVQVAGIRSDAQRDVAEIRRQAAEERQQHADALRGEQEKSTTAVDTAINKQYAPENKPEGANSQAWANQSEVDRRLRLPQSQGGGGMGGPQATALAEGVATGRVRLDRVPMKDGTLADVLYGKADTKGEHPLAVLHTRHGDAIRALPGMNATSPDGGADQQGQQQGQQHTGLTPVSPVGAGAGSMAALQQGYNQNLAGIPMTQAA